MSAEERLKAIYEKHAECYRFNGIGIREFVDFVEEQKILYGDLCVSGQATFSPLKRANPCRSI
jgi:hypothetical protein